MVSVHKLTIRFPSLFQMILVFPEWCPLSEKDMAKRDWSCFRRGLVETILTRKWYNSRTPRVISEFRFICMRVHNNCIQCRAGLIAAKNWFVLTSKGLFISNILILCSWSFSFTVYFVDNLYTFEWKRFRRPINLTLLSAVRVFTYSCIGLHLQPSEWNHRDGCENEENKILFSQWGTILLQRTFLRLSKIFAWEKIPILLHFPVTRDIKMQKTIQV